VALLRAAGIPARYHQAGLTNEVLKAVLPTFAYRFVPETIPYHLWCECHVSGAWISCEALFDQRLYDALLRRRLTSREQIPTIDWDGIHDLNTVTVLMLEDVGTHPASMMSSERPTVSCPRTLFRLFFAASSTDTPAHSAKVEGVANIKQLPDSAGC
jgi:hypothetical protein